MRMSASAAQAVYSSVTSVFWRELAPSREFGGRAGIGGPTARAGLRGRGELLAVRRRPTFARRLARRLPDADPTSTAASGARRRAAPGRRRTGSSFSGLACRLLRTARSGGHPLPASRPHIAICHQAVPRAVTSSCNPARPRRGAADYRLPSTSLIQQVLRPQQPPPCLVAGKRRRDRRGIFARLDALDRVARADQPRRGLQLKL